MIRTLRRKSIFNRFISMIKSLGRKNLALISISVLLLVCATIGFMAVRYRITISQRAQTVNLTVDATKPINPFTNKMLGQAFVNWEHSWGKPYPNEIPGLAAAMKEQGVGLIRYAGGLWANYVGFDRTTQKTPYTEWIKNGHTYYFHYGTDEIDSLNNLADAIGSDVMIQVNIAENDPTMWADMVKYANIEKGYNFKYWELGNEFEVDSELGITPEIYAERVKGYVDAMKAVDPSIHIVSGVPGSAHDAPRQGWSDAVTDLSHYLTLSAQAVSPQGKKVDDLSYHWYQACNSSTFQDLLRYSWPGVPTTSWRGAYSRIWSQTIPTRVNNEIIGGSSMMQGITELNFDACNYDNLNNANFLNALWASDVIGRLAYNGLDFITWYEGYGAQAYSTIYTDNATLPSKIFIRPSYYAFYMFNKYFGDQMVESKSFNDAEMSIWASTDSDDPGKLKLRVTNLTANDITAPISITGFIAGDGKVYTFQSDNPTDQSSFSITSSAAVFLNGNKLDPMNIVQSGNAIQAEPIVLNGSNFTRTFPAYTTTAIILNVLPAGASPIPTLPIMPSPTPKPLTVDSFTLVNASTNQPVKTINNGDTINLSGLPFNCMNIKAVTTPSAIGSVKFEYDGQSNYHTEDNYPYYINGGTENNSYCWTLSNGSHTIKATPYSASAATGREGTPLSITFSVTNAVLPAPASSSLDIYDGSSNRLKTGFGDCSYGSTVNFGNTSPTYNNKTYSIKAEIPTNSAFSICPNPYFKTGQYGALDFWVQAGGPGAGLKITTSALGQVEQTSVGASAYIVGGDVSFIPGKWEHVVIPFKDLDIASQQQVYRIYFSGASGDTPPSIYFGNISFTPRNDTPSPSPTPPTAPLIMYDPQSGSLANGFTNHSYGTGQSTILSNTTNVRSGSYSIKVVLPPWTGFGLLRIPAISTVGYKAIDYWVMSGGTNNQFSNDVQLVDGNNWDLTGQVSPSSYIVSGGNSFPAGQWVHVTIPLSKLNACNIGLWQFWFRGGGSAAASPAPIYLDTISLLPGTDPACPAIPNQTITPSPTLAATSTPTMTPTPTPNSVPTSTPTRTPTPTPTRTPTPQPSSAPTNTPVPQATNTPVPSASPTLTQAQKADFNRNGIVDIQDLSYLLTRWGSGDLTADINDDGTIGIVDLSILLSNWGQ